jgi:4-hydroxy-tetrahydrodipicolinate reductase
MTAMNAQVTRIAVLGATGRMGRAVIQAAAQQPGVRLGAAVERSGNPDLGQDAGTIAGLPAAGVIVGASLDACAGDFDVAVDFSRPDSTLAALDVCTARAKGLVIGTTGFDTAQRALILAAARRIPICMAGNFSIGVNLCLSLLEQAAKTLGDGFDIEIVEAHHRQKVDAPSGTALMMGEACARGAGRDLEDCAVYERHGHTGARDKRSIGFATVRGGDVVGDHSVLFLGDGERVEIAHRATSRANFANGALRAAAWLHNRAPGFYSMRDVLGF